MALGLEVGTYLELGLEVGTYLELGLGVGTCSWDLELGLGVETLSWDFELGLEISLTHFILNDIRCTEVHVVTLVALAYSPEIKINRSESTYNNTTHYIQKFLSIGY